VGDPRGISAAFITGSELYVQLTAFTGQEPQLLLPVIDRQWGDMYHKQAITLKEADEWERPILLHAYDFLRPSARRRSMPPELALAFGRSSSRTSEKPKWLPRSEGCKPRRAVSEFTDMSEQESREALAAYRLIVERLNLQRQAGASKTEEK